MATPPASTSASTSTSPTSAHTSTPTSSSSPTTSPPSSSASTTTSITSISTPLSPSSTSSLSSTTTPSSQSSPSTTSTTSTSFSTFFSTSTPPPQTSTSSPSSTSTFFQTTVITTDAQGSIVTVLTTASASNTPSTSQNTGSSNTSHTGAIVGGTVGGVAGLAILALILLICLRRQRRKDDFDGNFDPDRVGHSQGPLDLTAGEVEPYTYPQENAHPGQADMREAPHAAGSMHQYYNASPGAQPDYAGSRSPTDTHTTTSFLSPNAAPVAGVTYAPSSSSQSPSRSAKEREAFSRYNTTASTSGAALPSGSSDTGLHVVNQPDDAVVVHQDGGRVRLPADEEQVPHEIPPTYDSIPSDSRR